MENNRSINASEAHKAIEKIVSEGNPKEVGIFISLLSHRYMQEVGISKEQFITSLSNSIDELENGEH